jgi:hypothetical protein
LTASTFAAAMAASARPISSGLWASNRTSSKPRSRAALVSWARVEIVVGSAHRDPPRPWDELVQEFEPLYVQLRGENAHPGRIAALMSKRRHQSRSQHIVGRRNDGYGRRRLLRGASCWVPGAQDDIDLGLDQLDRHFRKLLSAGFPAPPCDDEVLALDEACPTQLVEHRDVMRCCSRLDGQTAKAIGTTRLLRAPRERPRRRRAAKKRDEIAPLHSITSSAATSSLSGTVSPSAFTVFRLMTSSNFVGCMTGRSAGFSPLRMRPV